MVLSFIMERRKFYFIILFSLVNNSEGDMDVRNVYLNKILNHKKIMSNPSDVLAPENNIEASTCIQKCMALLECSSFNYNVKEKMCEFLSQDGHLSSENTEVGWEFYKIVQTSTQNGSYDPVTLFIEEI